MSYPTLEQYNDALQVPALALIDRQLSVGTVRVNGLGTPMALCGGFALTYTIDCQGTKYAVRCFHKQSNKLEYRYKAISERIRSLQSNYFVEFQFQPSGIRINRQEYPIVKMAWAKGITLGEFLAKNYRDQVQLQNLLKSLFTLNQFLESHGMAHGDIQPGNVMVDDMGRSVRLIDYDGIYVEELKSLGSSELGHRNFQHPKRDTKQWNYTLDRFSFISLYVGIQALIISPQLWIQTQSDGDSVLFRANDFADPYNSRVFRDLLARNILSQQVSNFQSVCASPYDKVPNLNDFISGRNIPVVVKPLLENAVNTSRQYISAYPTLDAHNYTSCLNHVGDKVELIGQIVEVKTDSTKRGLPYVFINFGPWRGKVVKVSIWSEGLAAIASMPNSSWTGRWISVTGLMEPPYVSRKYNYSHLSISITQGAQITMLTKEEADFRLGKSATRSYDSSVNKKILLGIQSGLVEPEKITNKSRYIAGGSKQITTTSQNKAILAGMTQHAPPLRQNSSIPPTRPQVQSVDNTSGRKMSSNNCFIATNIYGPNAEETNLFRQFRDDKMLPSVAGRLAIEVYYRLSPFLVPLLNRNHIIRHVVKRTLDSLLKRIANSRF